MSRYQAGRLYYDLLDNFNTAEAAPLTSPRTAEPGPGTLTIVDTENKLSISGGQLVCAGGNSGINWTIRTSAADNNWRSVCWSPELGLFAAVAISGTGNRVM